MIPRPILCGTFMRVSLRRTPAIWFVPRFPADAHGAQGACQSWRMVSRVKVRQGYEQPSGDAATGSAPLGMSPERLL